MLVSTQTFVEPLEAWVKALHDEDFPAARHHAERLILAGELLAIHPDFRRCFSRHSDGVEPRDALMQMCQFLMCATEGRARAVSLASFERP